MTFYEWCTESDRQDLLEDWDYEKNNPTTPKDVSKASNRKAWWKCHVCGHEWETAINNRYGGSGCRVCGYKRVSKFRRMPRPGESLFDKCPELSGEWHPSKNDGLLPEEVPFKSNHKAWWLGKCGHEWEAAIYSRSTGNGCPYCANLRVLIGYNDLETEIPDVAREWHPTKNGELTPRDVVAKANKKVWWSCSVCGNEWQAVIAKRAIGQGCPICAKGNNISFHEKAIAFYLREVGLDVAENYRPDWLDPFELDVYLPNLRTAVEYDGYPWHEDIEKDLRKSRLCKQNGIELIRVRDNRCPEIDDGYICHYIPGRNGNALNKAIRSVIATLQINGSLSPEHEVEVDVAKDRMHIYDLMGLRKQENSFAQMCPDLIGEWHYERNGTMRPEDVTPYSDKKVWWKCRKHGHEWEAVVKSRTKGTGCPICSGNRVLEGFNDLATIAPDLAAEWHPIKNSPVTAAEVTPQSGMKAWWQCCTCGFEWQAFIYSRNGANHACPECARKRVQKKLRTPKPGKSLLERNPVLAGQWHPRKNGGLTPQDVTLSSHRKVWWLGKCGHEWEAAVYSRSAGNGCPICYSLSRGSSKNNAQLMQEKTESESLNP